MKTSTILLIMCGIFVIAAIVTAVLGISKMNKNGTLKYMSRKVGAVILCILLVVVTAANIACYYFESVISTYFTYSTVTEEEITPVVEHTQDVVEAVFAYAGRYI